LAFYQHFLTSEQLISVANELELLLFLIVFYILWWTIKKMWHILY